MVKAYINLEKEHEKLISCLDSYDLNSVDLGKIATQNEVHLVCTSFSMYGETKKNLSDIENKSNYVFIQMDITNDKEILKLFQESLPNVIFGRSHRQSMLTWTDFLREPRATL